MIKFSKKIAFKLSLIFIVMILVLLLYVIYSNANTKEVKFIQDSGISHLVYKYEGKEFVVNGQRLEEDDVEHFFVPSFCNLDCITLPNSSYVFENGFYYNGYFSLEELNSFQKSKAIRITNGVKTYIIHELENPTLSIEFSNANIEVLNNTKESKLSGNLVSIDNNGKTLFNGKFDYLTGHGNASWNYGGDKKSYNLKLNEVTSICGLKKSNRYVLIANSLDATEIRNAITYSYANYIGLENIVDYAYVNLFVNNEYRGLYLICTKLETDENVYSNKSTIDDTKMELVTKYDIDGIKEIKYFNNYSESHIKDYLIEAELHDRYNEDKEKAGFVTKYDNCYLIHYSKMCSYDEILRIAKIVQNFEDNLYDTTSDDYLKNIDIKSWLQKYVIDELTQNHDAGKTSSFMHISRTNDIIYGGPIWDYDNCFGAYINIPLSTRMYDIDGRKDTLLTNLVKRKEFFNQLNKYLIDELMPNMNKVLINYVEYYKELVKNDVYTSRLVNNEIEGYENDDGFYDKEIEKLLNNISSHIKYMERIYNPKGKYYKVYFNFVKRNIDDVAFFVKENDSILEEHQLNNFVYLDIVGWLDKDGNEFDFTKPITEDIELYAVWEGDTDASILQK